MWPFSKKESKKEYKEVTGKNATWVLAFIDAQAYPEINSSYSVQLVFKVVGYFTTREDAERKAKSAYGLRVIAPVIRGNDKDPIKGASFFANLK